MDGDRQNVAPRRRCQRAEQDDPIIDPTDQHGGAQRRLRDPATDPIPRTGRSAPTPGPRGRATRLRVRPGSSRWRSRNALALREWTCRMTDRQWKQPWNLTFRAHTRNARRQLPIGPSPEREHWRGDLAECAPCGHDSFSFRDVWPSAGGRSPTLFPRSRQSRAAIGSRRFDAEARGTVA